MNAEPTLTKVITQASKSPSLEEAQAWVGGYVQIVRLGAGSQMLVNEDGLMMGLPVNPLASQEYGAVIVGNVIILRKAARWK